MLEIGALAIPNQTLQAQLGTQPTILNIYQYTYGMFMDVYIGPTPIITGVICENLNRIVRDAYLGFSGDFIWNDTQGTSDPIYTGIGTRFQLIYLTAADLAALGLSG